MQKIVESLDVLIELLMQVLLVHRCSQVLLISYYYYISINLLCMSSLYGSQLNLIPDAHASCATASVANITVFYADVQQQ